ncbi:hypothetical protein EGR_09899 [Echinococcus granulosus]|uniref:Uncharacterized protein n=1 Tax=Echinococcus granulosus TaxID=6210 RepID=W6U3S5_ECHGR|nr:hypothetical protein EGR_09899 [Echinococcus granulosus]EUB55236.1 hypothetical protein EGR_09899 [Echinococcus granulosus]
MGEPETMVERGEGLCDTLVVRLTLGFGNGPFKCSAIIPPLSGLASGSCQQPLSPSQLTICATCVHSSLKSQSAESAWTKTTEAREQH